MTSPFTCFPLRGTVRSIFESETIPALEPSDLDARLATGWRHFGTCFFRNNLAVHAERICGILPLRIRLGDCTFSKSQRRVWNRNRDTSVRVTPALHCAEYDNLFVRHRQRFRENIPDSLRDFLSPQPAFVPTRTAAVEVRLGDALIAVSFLDLGEKSASSVYAMFDPDHAARRPGIHTLLCEIEEARRRGMEFLYLGYAYTVPSFYDYKKAFHALEAYDWETRWLPMPSGFEWSRPLPAGG